MGWFCDFCHQEKALEIPNTQNKLILLLQNFETINMKLLQTTTLMKANWEYKEAFILTCDQKWRKFSGTVRTIGHRPQWYQFQTRARVTRIV